VAGGKNASLGELFRKLGSQGVRVPNAFAFTVRADYDTLQSANAWMALDALLNDLDHTDVAFLTKRAAEAQQNVHDAIGSDALRQRTLSDRASSVDERETVQNVAWSTARVAGVENQLVVRS
jgi:phosphoenolpyruvate synthase/pyruvate phosphate dikinase